LCPKLPSRDELVANLQSVLQEANVNRRLDSIEIVVVRAYMTRLGLEYPSGIALPDTIEGWVEWAVHFSTNS
jgi:hypothetical protein